MQRVTTVNLNGNAYQIEEAAYDALVAYLNRARTLLENNPDRAEVIADLEQAIAEKCARFLGPHKTVVTMADMEQVLKEMGPVEPAPGGTSEARTETQADTTASKEKGSTGEREPQKRLYQLRDGAMIAGVCNGIAAYVGVDVNIIRLAFIVLTLLTHGAWAIVYVALALMLPAASTPEQQAAAHGVPFSAQELIDQARANSSRFQDKKWWRGRRREWRREWRRMRRRQWWGPNPQAPAGYVGHPLIGLMLPVFTLIQIALAVALVLAIVSLINTGAVFGWVVPPSLPLWAGILILFAMYQVVASPLRAAHYAYADGPGRGPAAAWNGLLGWAVVLVVFWLAYTNVPEVREFVRNLPQIWHDVMRDLAR